MNNYNKLKQAVRRLTKKCGECEGDKYLESMIAGNEPEDCFVCKGKGYIEELEFGCEGLYDKLPCEYVGVLEIDVIVLRIVSTGELIRISDDQFNSYFENLGKPLTLQDVLMLLDEQENVKVFLNGYGQIEIIEGKWPSMYIPLDLKPKDWSDETLQSIIDIVK